MQAIEVTAKSLEEAKKAAADKLGVDVSRIEATVVEQTKGLFGKVNLRVSAVVKAEAEPAPAKASTKAVKEAPSEPKAAEPKAKEPKAGGRRGRKEPIQDVQDAFEAPAHVEAPSESEAPAAAAKPARGRRAPKAAEPAEGEAGEGEVAVTATQEDADKFADLLRGLIASADLTVEVKAPTTQGRYVNLQLDGRDAAFLVGKHGEVLNALQYLVNIVGSRKVGNGVRATLDGNDYRRRREETLTQLATNIADQVKKRGEEAVLDALPAFERRIVHKALSTLDGITTYSEGEEPNRRVVIAPAE